MFDRFYGGVITLGMKQISSSRYKYIIFAILYIMFVARIQFGIDLEDEAYQVSSYYQIWQGKIPLMSIWDGHTGYFLLAPFFAIYHYFVPGLDGVTIYFRVISKLFFSIFAVCFMWMVWKKEKLSLSWLLLLASPILLWYTRTNQLNYNAGAAWVLTLMCSWYYFCYRDTRLFFLLLGWLSALLCIFYPTMLIISFVMGVFLLIRRYRYDEGHYWYFYLFGLGMVGGAFILWIFSNGSFQEFMTAVEHILHAPHTEYRGPLDSKFFFKTYIASIFHFVWRKWFVLLFVSYLAGIMYCMKKLPKMKRYHAASCIFVCYVMLSAVVNRQGYGYAIMALFLGFLVIMAVCSHNPFKQNWIYYLGVVLFVGIYSLTSDNKNVLLGVNSATGLLVAGMVTSILELRKRYPIHRGICAVLLSMIALSGIAQAYFSVYNDVSVPRCIAGGRVSTGVFQGIYTSADRRKYIEEIEHIMHEEPISSEDTIAVFTLEPSIYLMTKAEILAPWTFDVQYLFKGFYNDKPLTDYYRSYNRWPDIMVATNRNKKNKDVGYNEEYRIHEVLKEKYHLVLTRQLDYDTYLYMWRKS